MTEEKKAKPVTKTLGHQQVGSHQRRAETGRRSLDGGKASHVKLKEAGKLKIKMSYRTQSSLDNSFSGSIIAYNLKHGNSYKYPQQYRNLLSIWLSWSWTRVVRIQASRNSMESPREIQNTK